MTTIAALRTDYLNGYLHRADSSTKPWTAAELDRLLTDAITKLWPRLGVLTFGDVATDHTKNLYNVPGALLETYRLSRIELLDSSGRYIDRVTSWRQHDGLKVVIKPLLADGSTLRFYGWIPFATDGSDLPVDLEETIAHRAAGKAYANLAAELINSERQQNLDTGRIVGYADAAGFAAYHERLYLDGLTDHPARISFAPRAAHRR